MVELGTVLEPVAPDVVLVFSLSVDRLHCVYLSDKDKLTDGVLDEGVRDDFVTTLNLAKSTSGPSSLVACASVGRAAYSP